MITALRKVLKNASAIIFMNAGAITKAKKLIPAASFSSIILRKSEFFIILSAKNKYILPKNKIELRSEAVMPIIAYFTDFTFSLFSNVETKPAAAPVIALDATHIKKQKIGLMLKAIVPITLPPVMQLIKLVIPKTVPKINPIHAPEIEAPIATGRTINVTERVPILIPYPSGVNEIATMIAASYYIIFC